MLVAKAVGFGRKSLKTIVEALEIHSILVLVSLSQYACIKSC